MVEFLSFFINDTNESVFLFLRNVKDLSLIRNGELVYHEVNKSELLEYVKDKGNYYVYTYCS